MTTTQTAPAPQRAYDNNGQYSRTGILRYEMIFGDGYISTGGHETTEYLCVKLGPSLRRGGRVLDVGSGIGGAAIHLARTYGVEVTGIDLSPEMVAIAHERQKDSGAEVPVTFLLGDILETSFDRPFDIVWSRDALMHVPDKPRLFARLYDLMAPGARLAITDYGRGLGAESAEFRAYVAETGYHLTDPASYGRLLEDAGFTEVQVEDATDRFVGILRRESERLAAHRAEFLESFSEKDLNYLVDRWAMKVGFCGDGDMKWGIFTASKRA
jgi:phosphoethanolamine N-methyltransferase